MGSEANTALVADTDGGNIVVTRTGPSFWAVVEIMGHRVAAGLVTEVEMFGGKLMMIEQPRSDGTVGRSFYGSGSVFSMCFTTEKEVREHYTNKVIEPLSPDPHARYAIEHREFVRTALYGGEGDKFRF